MTLRQRLATLLRQHRGEREEIARLTGAVNAERAAVVRYLRSFHHDALDGAADHIKAGEHIAKEQA